MKYDLYEYETKLTAAGYQHIAGTDEVGRGPMAGPLVAAAVVLRAGYRLEGLNDSKMLSPKQRDRFYDILIRDAVEYRVAFIDVSEVDRLNVYAASKLAMTRCIQDFRVPVDFILTDAMKLDVGIEFIDLIHGDQRSASIAAASVIAKVTRDRFMAEMDAVYPEYGFKKHKGYVTKFHREMLDKYGPCPLHRRSFAPVANYLAGIRNLTPRGNKGNNMFQNKTEIKNLRGGKGRVIVEKWDILPPHCKLYNRITIPEHCSIGEHVHIDDEEMIYCLSGNGKVKIDGVCHPFLPGMVDHTKKGGNHSMINDDPEPLVILAVITE